jgi:hypothetical protein
LPPGQALIQQFTAPSNAEVLVFEEISGLYRDGNTWVLQEDAVTSRQVLGGPQSD